MFFSRCLAEAMQAPVSRNKVRLLFGARQTGKTELLRHLVSTESTLTIDLAQARERIRYERDPSVLARELAVQPRHVQHVVIDEIQKVPALLDEVQSTYDGNKHRFQFYLTGSSARRLRQHSSNLLPGRSHVYRLSPICQWEAVRSMPVDWDGALAPRSRGAAPAKPFPKQSLARTLLLGNLPGIRLEPLATAQATLAAYVENYLEEEIRREALVRNLGNFAVFLQLAALESGKTINVSRLSQESGVPASTIKNFFQILIDTYVGFWMQPYRRAGRKRLLTAPRFLLFDVGVRNAAARLELNESNLETEGPSLLEQWVGLELLYRAAYRGRSYEVGFWRTVSGAEVDFVWQGPKADVPVEVKWTANPRPQDARHLEAFLDAYPNRAHQGLLICRCANPQQLTERVRAVPWSAF